MSQRTVRLYCATCKQWQTLQECANGCPDTERCPNATPETPHELIDTRRYRIVRFYRDAVIRRRIILSGLTLEQAQAHCSNPETSSSTATSVVARRRTARMGAWFDGYEEDK